jgi:transposase
MVLPQVLTVSVSDVGGSALRLFVGDDWAEDHHDVELMDEAGKRLAKARLPEGVAGIARLHALVAEQLGERTEDDGVEVVVGIETDRGPWVRALLAAGYTVPAVNPLVAARYRERRAVSGAKSDAADAHMLADMVRTDAHQLRPVAGDTEPAEAVKVLARAHKTLIWERTRHTQRLRHALRDYFPAALAAFEDLDAPDTLELLAKAPIRAPQRSCPARRSPRRSSAPGAATSTRRPRRSRPRCARPSSASPRRSPPPTPPPCGPGRGPDPPSTRRSRACSGRSRRFLAGTRPLSIIVSQPGLGPILGARVLAEFGDDPDRYADAKARRNYAGTSPITRASGKKRVVAARHVHNDRLIDALMFQASRAIARLARRPRLLRQAARTRRRLQRRTAPGRQPTRRHPARMPQERHPLRRDRRMDEPHRTSHYLTLTFQGCLSLADEASSAAV